MAEDDLRLTPSEAEYMLAMAIGKKLMERFAPKHGSQSNRLAAAVLNYAFMMKPGDEEAEQYLRENSPVILSEIDAIRDDDQLNAAFSLLYSFMLIRIGPTDFDRSHGLATRASDLNIVLRTPEEFCGPVNAMRFLAYVQEQSIRLWNS